MFDTQKGSRGNRLPFLHAYRQREILISCRDFRQFDGSFQFSLKSLLSLKREPAWSHSRPTPFEAERAAEGCGPYLRLPWPARCLPGCPPRGARLRGGRPHFFPKKWGERRAGGLRPPWTPQVRGLMAAVGCTNRAKTGHASPPVSQAMMLQALPRLGRHASGLPCKPWKSFRCTCLARRAAVGAMPLKYRGSHRGHP